MDIRPLEAPRPSLRWRSSSDGSRKATGRSSRSRSTTRPLLAAWRHDGAGRWLAVADGGVVGYVAVVPLHGWSSHVGEIRLIVDPAHRGEGVGTALWPGTRSLEAFRGGLSKLVVEVLANQEFTIEMFRALWGSIPKRC